MPGSAYIKAAAIKGPSNKHLVRLALKHRCLAGAHLARKQESAMRALDACQHSSQFLILFGKLNGNKFRGLYAVEKKTSGRGKLSASVGGGAERHAPPKNMGALLIGSLAALPADRRRALAFSCRSLSSASCDISRAPRS